MTTTCQNCDHEVLRARNYKNTGEDKILHTGTYMEICSPNRLSSDLTNQVYPANPDSIESFD